MKQLSKIISIIFTSIILYGSGLAMHPTYMDYMYGNGQARENFFRQQDSRFARGYGFPFNNQFQSMPRPHYQFNQQPPYMMPNNQFSADYQLNSSQRAMMALTKYMQTSKPQDLQVAVNYMLQDLIKNYSPQSWWGKAIFAAAIHQLAQNVVEKVVTPQRS